MNEWHVDPSSDKHKGRSVWCTLSDGKSFKIATIHRNSEHLSQQEFEATLRLIASAPELLSILRTLCKDRAITRATDEAFEARNKARKLLSTIDAMS